MGSVEAAASPTVAAERRKPPLGKRGRRCPGSDCGGPPAASGGPYVLGQERWPLGPVWAGLCPLTFLLSPAVQGCAWPFILGQGGAKMSVGQAAREHSEIPNRIEYVYLVVYFKTILNLGENLVHR